MARPLRRKSLSGILGASQDKGGERSDGERKVTNLSPRNSHGQLTPYALACGCFEHYKSPLGDDLRLWQEHVVYHVRETNNGVRHYWYSYVKLTEARNRFALSRAVLKSVTNGRPN